MNPADSFILALAQIRIVPGDHEDNFQRAIEFVAKAAAASADVILLPEALPFGWTDPSAKEFADGIPDGNYCRALRAAAKGTGIHICCGLVERAGGRLFNSAVLIDPNGTVMLHHRKINELAFAHNLYSLGDRLGVCDTRFGRMGLMICADAFVPGQVISRALALMGAQIILSPCAWAVAPEHDNLKEPYGQLWVDNYGPVCRESGVWIAGCSNVGRIEVGAWKGHICIGNSIVMNPDGEVARRGVYGESAEELLLIPIQAGPGSRSAGESKVEIHGW